MTGSKLQLLREKFSYALGDFSLCLGWNGVSAFLFASWLRCGIPAAVIGGLMFAGQFLTAFSDLGAGTVIDRFSRHGYRVWVRCCAVPIAVLLFAVFSLPRAMAGFPRTAAAAACYVLFMFVYSCGSIPFCSLLKTMTDDVSVRVSFGSWRVAGAFLGAFSVTTAYPMLSEALSPGVAIGIVSVALCRGLLISSSGVVERNLSHESSGGSLFDGAFWRVLSDRSFVRLFVVAVLFCSADAARFGALAVYAAKTAATPAWCAGGFACLTLAPVLGAAMVPSLSRWIGLTRLLPVAAGLSSFFSACVFLTGGASSALMFLELAAAAMFASMMPTVCNVLVASFADRRKEAQAGRMFAVWGLTGKIGCGLGALTMSLVMTFLPGSTGALVSLSLVPASFLVLLLIILRCCPAGGIGVGNISTLVTLTNHDKLG